MKVKDRYREAGTGHITTHLSLRMTRLYVLYKEAHFLSSQAEFKL